MLGQFILRPLSLHRESPSVGTEWTRSVPSNGLTRALSSGWALVSKSTENGQCRHFRQLFPLPASSAGAAVCWKEPRSANTQNAFGT